MSSNLNLISVGATRCLLTLILLGCDMYEHLFLKLDGCTTNPSDNENDSRYLGHKELRDKQSDEPVSYQTSDFFHWHHKGSEWNVHHCLIEMDGRQYSRADPSSLSEMQHEKPIDSLIKIFICVDYHGTNTCSLVEKIVFVDIMLMMMMNKLPCNTARTRNSKKRHIVVSAELTILEQRAVRLTTVTEP